MFLAIRSLLVTDTDTNVAVYIVIRLLMDFDSFNGLVIERLDGLEVVVWVLGECERIQISRENLGVGGFGSSALLFVSVVTERT